MSPFTPEGTASTDWDGMPKVLAQDDTVTMPQTPNGSLILGYFNQSQQDNAGSLLLSSGAEDPITLPAPPLMRWINILVHNWQANNLKLTNVSDHKATPIFVEAFGPGVPGVQPKQLVIGTPMQLAMRQSAQGVSAPRYMQLKLTLSSGDLATVAIVGGPADPKTGNNAYVIALNSAAGDTGPPTRNPPPEGYYATRKGNSYTFQFNWGSAQVYVVNMSSQTAKPVTALLQSL
jgi:hypothetical protein